MDFGANKKYERVKNLKLKLSTTLLVNLYTLAVNENIPFNEALELGIKIKAYEKELISNHPETQLLKKFISLKNELENISQKYWDLKNKYEPKEFRKEILKEETIKNGT